MKKITLWTARRAGGRITINGQCDGLPIKIVGVDTIKAPVGGLMEAKPIATDKNGVDYLLI